MSETENDVENTDITQNFVPTSNAEGTDDENFKLSLEDSKIAFKNVYEPSCDNKSLQAQDETKHFFIDNWSSESIESLQEARVNLILALESIAMSGSQLDGIEEIEIQVLKVSALKQITSAKLILGKVLNELDLLNTAESETTVKTENVKVEMIEEDDNKTSWDFSQVKSESEKCEVKIEDNEYLEDIEIIKKKRTKTKKSVSESTLSNVRKKKRKVKQFEKLQCPYCEKFYASSKGELRLERHIEKWHTNTFPCNKCQAVFNNKPDLTKHLSDHRRKKEKICTICGATVQSGCLPRHMRYHGEKKFSCDICGTSFHEKTKLSRHRIIHTGERPHVCIMCGKGFNQKNNLKTHMKSHTSGILQNFDLAVIKNDPA